MSEGKVSNLAHSYLILYNVVQTIGWSYLALQIVTYYAYPNPSGESLYDTVKWTMIIFQNLAVLEVLHALLKIVRSSVGVTLQQIMSRVLVVGAVLIPTELAKNSVGFPMLLFGWSVTEVIRYLNYSLNLINAVPYIVVWLRYSTFIVLYPIGVTGELLCIYSAYLESSKTGMWSVTMPNIFNFAFSFPYFLIVFMACYVPFFPKLYLHMFTQRRRVLGKESGKKKL